MRLFLDQMFREEVAVQLRALGHDVVQASDVGLSRADDAEILHQTVTQSRVLVTLDGHFGNWAVLPLTRHCGVIRLRVHPTTSEKVLHLLQTFLFGKVEEQFENQLVIVSATRVRWIRTAQ